jgi:hypothetical protein
MVAPALCSKIDGFYPMKSLETNCWISALVIEAEFKLL